MLISKKDFRKQAVSMGVAKSREVSQFLKELQKEQYDDDRDMIDLWRKAQTYRRWKQSSPRGACCFKKTLATKDAGYF